MTTGELHLAPLLSVLAAIAVLGTGAEPARGGFTQTGTAASPDRHCWADEEAFTVLKLTTIEGGVRVDYEFVRFRATRAGRT